MADIPLSMNELEDIATEVARELLEQWAIDDRFTEEQELEAAQNAASDAIFVINRFMEAFNDHMMIKAEQVPTKLVLPE
jgi:hypothetical protein